MNFTKTILAVACGIILVPFLICGGCFFLGAVGTTTAVVGTSAAVVGAGAAVAESGSATTPTPNTTLAPKTSLTDKPQFTDSIQSEVAADQKRFQEESSTYNDLKSLRDEALSQVSLEEQKLDEWIANNPEPQSLDFGMEDWWSLGKTSSVKASFVSGTKTHVLLRRSDDQEVNVDVYKLDAASRIHAWELVDKKEKYDSELEDWKTQLQPNSEAVANAKSQVKSLPNKPKPAITRNQVIAASRRKRANVVAIQEQAKAAEASKPKMNAANYARCQPGMSYGSVIAIVGPPDSEMSRSKIGDIDTVLYMWKAGLFANANMTFQNGELVVKAQFGL